MAKLHCSALGSADEVPYIQRSRDALAALCEEEEEVVSEKGKRRDRSHGSGGGALQSAEVAADWHELMVSLAPQIELEMMPSAKRQTFLLQSAIL